jgi:hypothetical protein
MPDLDDLRYPIGRFKTPVSTSSEERAEHIQTLRQLPERLRAAVSGLDEVQLGSPYRPDGWTVHELVHHVADSHANSYIRFKFALTEDWPTIKPYDEAAWARLADTRLLPIEVSLTMLEGMHTRWVALLESLADEDFERGYVHPALGLQSLAEALALYAWHSHHHTAHITRLRARQGW